MQEWSKLISAGVGPIIVISACGLLCLAFYNRLAAVVTRLRAFDRERLLEQEALSLERRADNPDEHAIVRHQEILGALEVQTHHVIRRARLIRSTLMCLLLTIALLALCSLAVGLSAIYGSFVYLAVPLFVMGLLLLVTAIVFAMVEVKHSLDPVELENRFVEAMVERSDEKQVR